MTDNGFDRAVTAWLEDGPTSMSDRALKAALDEVHTTRQRRAWWSARRFPTMNTLTRAAIAAAAVLAVVAVGIIVLPRQQAEFGAPGPTVSPTPSPSPTASPDALREGTLPAGTYAVTPFVGEESAPCQLPALGATPPPCPEASTDDSIRVAFSVPEGWAGAPFNSIWLLVEQNSPPAGAGMIFGRGGWLHSDPCVTDGSNADIEVGPTVDDFANALAEHPLLDVTAPVDVTLDGYSGKYVDLQVPADIFGCFQSYFPWEPGLYAQGPSHRWHLWILDVDGVRVVVNTFDYPETSQEHQDELQAIVDSVQITP